MKWNLFSSTAEPKQSVMIYDGWELRPPTPTEQLPKAGKFPLKDTREAALAPIAGEASS